MPKKQKTVRMFVDVTFDPSKTDAESVSNALDVLMDTAMGTPGILDDCGDVRVGGFYPQEDKKNA